jgi:4-amino-4-deoxy-L-arabinose transferase-like glycosyltransferase
VNLLESDYLTLTGPLKCGQIAPLLFLWGELTVYRLFGDSEFAVRLLPLLAGLAALPLFWRLAWRTLPPLAATFAVGILAASYWPVAMTATVKPYTIDLLMALLLLVLAVEWLDQPQRWIWLALLTALCPIALFSSFPAVFVAGAVSLALLPQVWRRRDWTARTLFALYNLGMVVSFLLHFLVVGMNQLHGADGHVDIHYRDYWSNGFPPGDLLAFGKWFVLIHTGRMFAYPIGAADGGSTVTALVAFVGLICLVRWQTGRARMVLLLAPFALTFVAAAMHKYPYGGCCRLSQHLAPTTCLLIGLGLATLIERFAVRENARRCCIVVVCVLLTAVMFGGLARDVLRPYKSVENLEARTRLHDVFAHVSPRDRIIVLNNVNDIDPVSQWWLARFGGTRLEWDRQWDRDRSMTCDHVWTLEFYYGESPSASGQTQLPSPSANPADPQHLGQYGIMRCQVTCWTRRQGEWTPSADPYAVFP